MTLREALVAAGAAAAEFEAADCSQAALDARDHRNELMRYAYDYGVTIQKVVEIVGMSPYSLAYVHGIVKCGLGRGAVLDDPAPQWPAVVA